MLSRRIGAVKNRTILMLFGPHAAMIESLAEKRAIALSGAPRQDDPDYGLCQTYRAGHCNCQRLGRRKRDSALSRLRHRCRPDPAEAGGRRAWTLKADLARPEEVSKLAQRAFDLADIYGLVNNASLFGPSSFHETKPDEWNSHIAVNLTAPFLLTQEFARLLGKGRIGRVVNMLDWRALRPGPDHFAYTVSKAALAGMTRALALSLSPKVAVNGLALGAILPVEGKGMDSRLTDSIPLGRWGQLREVGHAAVFLLGGPSYLSGEIIQLDGGRHLH
jgi:NAD(P)-dependent dehydrogenase (short-subunit alcohol dehydrogenase family)